MVPGELGFIIARVLDSFNVVAAFIFMLGFILFPWVTNLDRLLGLVTAIFFQNNLNNSFILNLFSFSDEMKYAAQIIFVILASLPSLIAVSNFPFPRRLILAIQATIISFSLFSIAMTPTLILCSLLLAFLSIL